jgi:hypothetical protein
MASLHETESGYAVHWRFARQQFKQSAATADRREADTIRGQVEATLRRIKEGWLSVPKEADYATLKRFIWTGG